LKVIGDVSNEKVTCADKAPDPSSARAAAQVHDVEKKLSFLKKSSPGGIGRTDADGSRHARWLHAVCQIPPKT
jgi:hypothetical protein